MRERCATARNEKALFNERSGEFFRPDKSVPTHATTDLFCELRSRPIGDVDRVSVLALERRNELDQGLFTRHRADHNEWPVLRRGGTAHLDSRFVLKEVYVRLRARGGASST